MRIIATIIADLDTSPIGTSSRLRETLDGVTVLRRTVERARQIRGIDGVYILVRTVHAAETRAMLDGLDVGIETHNAPPSPHVDLVRASRAWGLDAWRGGVGSLCVFDEDFDAAVLRAIAAKASADSVLSIPAAAPLLDAELMTAMVAHHRANIEMARITFMQAPPGLTGMILASDAIEQLQSRGMPPGALLVYQPQSPSPDLTGREACYRPDASIVRANGRLLYDTSRSVERIRRIFAAGGAAWDAARMSRWLASDDASSAGSLPAEIEIELTTEDQLTGHDLLHPRGDDLPQRGPIRVQSIERLIASIAGRDDIRVVLGGFGEPTLHPRFAEICKLLRGGGVQALAVRTNGIVLPSAADSALFDTPVDVVEVIVDAAKAETYRQVHGFDAFNKVIANIERWRQRRVDRQSARPLIVPSLIKSHETLGDLEAFVDRWQSTTGCYVMRGASHYARQRSDRAVTLMTPPTRGPCKRIFSRLVILADGTTTTCDQDYAGLQALGNVDDESLESLWQSTGLQAIRDGHHEDCSLCPSCDEWHRP